MISENESTMIDSTFDDKLQWSLLPNVKSNVGTEDHLQSLGFNVNKGLPQFKLNEPGPAALASSIFQQKNMVNDESEQSFVVLGKTYLESIKDDCSASYMEIQQKSTLTDHSPLISMMSPSEIEESLKKVLEENIKLKETLRQNNSAIKQQFNTIAMWQKEVMSVCDNHKQKFVETRELINKLKNENDELREKVAKNQHQETSSIKSTNNLSIESVNVNSLLKKSNYQSTENIPNFSNICSSCLDQGNELENVQMQTENEQELKKKIVCLSIELNNLKVNHLKTQEVLQELEKRYVTDIELFSQQLQKANKELEAFKQKSDLSNSSELQRLVGKCCEKDIELQYLKETITSLEQQIKKFEENAFSLTNLRIESSEEASQDKHLFKENVEFYNTVLGELGKCFALQCSRYLRIQEFLKESANIIQIFENKKIPFENIFSEEQMNIYKDKLCNYRKNLINEQLQSINDKQTTIKVQKQFQKILSDYNSVIYELEILKDENTKLITMQTKAAEENSQKLVEIEKHLDTEKKNLDNEKTFLLEGKLNLQMEKKILNEEKEKVEVERNSLSLEKERLMDERSNLIKERTSLDRQSKLYEAEEGTLQKEKKFLQKRCEMLTYQIDTLKLQLNENNVTIQKLQASNNKLKENEEIISVYKIQTQMHQKEFEEMRIAQKNLQDQLQSLSMANLELRTENDRLGGQANEQNSSTQPRYCGLCAKYISPEERHGMGVCTPEFD